MSTRAGPATVTQIIYAAVVGTSIPRIKQANAVKKKCKPNAVMGKRYY